MDHSIFDEKDFRQLDHENLLYIAVFNNDIGFIKTLIEKVPDLVVLVEPLRLLVFSFRKANYDTSLILLELYGDYIRSSYYRDILVEFATKTDNLDIYLYLKNKYGRCYINYSQILCSRSISIIKYLLDCGGREKLQELLRESIEYTSIPKSIGVCHILLYLAVIENSIKKLNGYGDIPYEYIIANGYDIIKFAYREKSFQAIPYLYRKSGFDPAILEIIKTNGELITILENEFKRCSKKSAKSAR